MFNALLQGIIIKIVSFFFQIPLIISAIWISISGSLQTLLIADTTMSKMVEFSSRKPYCIVHNDRYAYNNLDVLF